MVDDCRAMDNSFNGGSSRNDRNEADKEEEKEEEEEEEAELMLENKVEESTFTATAAENNNLQVEQDQELPVADSTEMDEIRESGNLKVEEEEEGGDDGQLTAAGKEVEEEGKITKSEFKFAYSMIDEGNYAAARMLEAFGSEAEKALSYGFEPGDMVWGRVKSHPWWPGYIHCEAFAASDVRRTKREGHVLVAFFGDSSYGWFDPAELIQFDKNYYDKSRQSNSRNFVRAVEEGVDEVRRRAALGLTCYCRNSFNFRSTKVQGYFSVDVCGYERGCLYSVNQIRTARNGFKPAEAVSFLQQLAMNPRDSEQKDIASIKNVAMFVALRKATFEEFDETYSQAFGTLASRPRIEATGVLDQQPGKLQSQAPLSGRMVMAEAPGEMKSSSKPLKVTDKPKDKFVLKKREKPSEPKVKQFSSHAGNVSSAYKERPVSMVPGDYSFQKRTSAVQIKPQVLVEQEEIQDIGRIDPALTSETLDSKQESAKLFAMSKYPLKGSSASNFDKPVKKAKAPQHLENSSFEKNGAMEKKKKKKRKLDSEALQDHPHKLLRTVKDGESVRKSAGNSIGIGLVPPEVDLVNIKVELPQVVDDLLNLALDPFHGVERNGPAIVQHVLLQFRSLVYQKSLVSAPVSVPEMSNLSENKSPTSSAPAKIPYGVSTKEPPPKLKKAHERPDDPTKAGRKRSLSERQEEKSAKRLKKLHELKSLTTEKKAGTPKVPEPKQEYKEVGVTVSPKLTRPNAVKKPEQLAKAAEPAMLVLKFPPRTTLPSVAELKARFARFGPLDHSAFRVFWKSYQCRVVFKHKAHALAAHNYAVRNKALFGQEKVIYQVRDVVVPGAAADVPEYVKRQIDDATDEVPLSRHGADADSTDYLGELRKTAPVHRRPQQSAVQLKSCLKKPPGEETVSAMDAGVSRENTRVRFKLDGDESDSRREEKMVSTTTPHNHTINNNSNRIDISSQMLSLMMRCNDIVMDISSSLGYVPYHPL